VLVGDADEAGVRGSLDTPSAAQLHSLSFLRLVGCAIVLEKKHILL
jgi:hypothetical protein